MEYSKHQHLMVSETTPNKRADPVDDNNKKATENTSLGYTRMTNNCIVDRLKQRLATVEGTDGEYDEKKILQSGLSYAKKLVHLNRFRIS